MAEQYWVWALDRDNMPLTTEGPWGPYDAQTARTYARISATEGSHDRAVSRGADPERFKVVRIYQAGTGEHIYAGGGVTANASRRQTWHVVYSQGGVILGVYGAALLSEAQEQAQKVERTTGFPAYVKQVIGPRPSVGMTANAGGADLSDLSELDREIIAVRSELRELGGWGAHGPHGPPRPEDQERIRSLKRRYEELLAERDRYESNEARPHGELNWYKITYSAPAGGTAVTHVRAPNSLEALERAAFQLGYEPDVWSIEGMLNGDWTRL